jgi:hypothetical protein
MDDPDYLTGALVAGSGGIALVAAGISGTALVAGGASAESDCFPQPATNKTEAAKLRRMALLMRLSIGF